MQAAKLKLVGGKYVSSKAKVGAECSKAMSDWKSGRSTAKGVGKILGKCRSQARALKSGAMYRAAGKELKAQVQESRARRGKVGEEVRGTDKPLIAVREKVVTERIAQQKEKARKALKGSLFDPEKIKFSHTERQPIARTSGYQELASEGKAANEYLTKLLNKGKGIGSELGLPTVKPEDIKPGKEQEVIDKHPDGLVMLGPIKGEKRATQKVNDWFGGDWRMLNDIARATIAVKSIDQVKSVIDKLHKRGVIFAGMPKDRITKPTDAGYRDVVLSVKSPSGVIGELQIHLTPILRAKAEAHKDYETTRTIDGELARTGRAATPKEKAIYSAAVARMKGLYGRAWEEASRPASRSGSRARD